jgi:hypothetical protein
MWDLLGHLEWDPRRWEGFPGDDLYNYTAPLEPVKEDKEGGEVEGSHAARAGEG